MENIWIIQCMDGDYDEVVGAFEGNLFEILMNKFTLQPEYMSNDDYIRVYSMPYLLGLGEKFKGSYEKNAEPVLVSTVNGYSFGKSEIKSLVKKHYDEFRAKYPDIGLHVSSDEVQFKENEASIQKEISGLSPETLEYIRKHGI